MLFNLCCSKVSIKTKYKYRKPWLCICTINELYKDYLQIQFSKLTIITKLNIRLIKLIKN